MSNIHLAKLLCIFSFILSIGLISCAETSSGPAPDLPSYSVISDEVLPPYKRTVEVELDNSVSRDELGLIAKEIKALNRKPFERTFISYQLKGHTTKDIGMSYAISHYNPDMEINFLGLSTEDEEIIWKKIAALESSSERGEIIGRWINYGYPATIDVLEKKSGEYQFHKIYPEVTTEENNWEPKAKPVKAIPDGETLKLIMPYVEDEAEWYRLYPTGELRFQSNLGTDSHMPKATRPEAF